MSQTNTKADDTVVAAAPAAAGDKGGIVCEWLERIGLGYAVGNFKEKGVDSPQALIGLTFQDYDDLNITALADRKRLFELVQRVRMAARAVKRNASVEGEEALDSQEKQPVQEMTENSENSNHVDKERELNVPQPAARRPKAARSKLSLSPTKNGMERQGGQRVASKPNLSSRLTRDSDGRNSRRGNMRRPKTAEVVSKRISTTSKNDTGRQSVDGSNAMGGGRSRPTAGTSSPDRRSKGFGGPHRMSLRSVFAPQNNRPRTADVGRPVTTKRTDFNSRIRVVVRKRPMSRKEKVKGDVDVVEINENELILHEPKVKVDMTRYVESHAFAFDDAFNEKSENVDIYDETCKPLVSAVFEGAKATCFAYGQTGSGKTYTMMGPDADGRQRSTHTPGLYELAARDMFERMATPAYEHLQMCVSFFEIYGGKLFDLLNERRRLRCLEDGKKHANIVGLKRLTIGNVDELFDLMERGHEARSTGQTGANLDSSRSHAVLQIVLKDVSSGKGQGKISFIDLAGSERGQDTTHADRQTRMEGAEINKSLLALKECIRALYHEQDHTPFRGSKLTQVLKDSFTGNGRTVMVVTISPNMGNCEHTLNTLRYGYRVKELGNDSSSASRRSSAGNTLDLNRDFGTNANGRHRLNTRNAFKGRDGSKAGDKSSGRSSGVRKSTGGINSDLVRRKQGRNVGRGNERLSVGSVSTKAESQKREEGSAASDRKKKEAPGQETGFPSAQDRKKNPPAPQAAPSLPVGGKNGSAAKVKPNSASSSPPRARNAPPAPQPEPESGSGPTDEGVENVETDTIALELDLSQEHQELVSTILSEEEDLVASHREHIHSMMNLVKEEMAILNRVDMPGAKIDKYAVELGKVLDQKLKQIVGLKERLDTFQKHLLEEETLHSSMSSSTNGSPMH
jgi:kinesin family member 2/24